MMAADATNSTLDDESLVMLLEEVSAMVAAERPLLAGLVDLEGGFLRKLRRAAREVRKRVEQGQPVPKAIAGLSNRYKHSDSSCHGTDGSNRFGRADP